MYHPCSLFLSVSVSYFKLSTWCALKNFPIWALNKCSHWDLYWMQSVCTAVPKYNSGWTTFNSKKCKRNYTLATMLNIQFLVWYFPKNLTLLWIFEYMFLNRYYVTFNFTWPSFHKLQNDTGFLQKLDVMNSEKSNFLTAKFVKFRIIPPPQIWALSKNKPCESKLTLHIT